MLHMNLTPLNLKTQFFATGEKSLATYIVVLEMTSDINIHKPTWNVPVPAILIFSIDKITDESLEIFSSFFAVWRLQTAHIKTIHNLQKCSYFSHRTISIEILYSVKDDYILMTMLAQYSK